MVPNLAAMDLNLLLVFEALLVERNVTNAARRLGLSQSATSHALSRLREALGDPLFTRTAHGMLPTTEANRLSAPILAALDALRATLCESAPFDASTASGVVRICSADLGQTLILPALCAQLAARAPGVSLHITGFPDDAFQMLTDGRADVTIGIAPSGPDINQQPLLQQRFCCVVREGHPRLRDDPEPLSLDDYAALGHVLVSPRGLPRGYVDRALAERGLTRRVVLVAPHLLPAALAVVHTDHVLTIPEAMAASVASLLPLRTLPPPLPVEPFLLTMGWHDRRNRDPLHLWVREILRALSLRLAAGEDLVLAAASRVGS